MMKALLESVEKLKQSEVKKLVDARLREFEGIGNKPSMEIFKELCFCILTANFNAEKSMKIQKNIGDGFLVLSGSQLSRELSNLGHRYPRARAKYIVEARRYKDTIKEIIRSFKDENLLREWLVENVNGIGYKEASHFLRNIGYKNYAIIDFHIIDILTRYKLIEKLRSPTKGKYLEIEKLLKEIARKLDLSLAELDLYLWFIETGKILK